MTIQMEAGLGLAMLLHLAFVATLLMVRIERRKDHSAAMTLFFVALALVNVEDAAALLLQPDRPRDSTNYLSPCLLLLGPAIRLYAEAITSREPLPIGWRMLKRFWAFGGALVLSIPYYILGLESPADAAAFAEIKSDPRRMFSMFVVAVGFLAMLVLYVAVTTWSLWKTMRVLRGYRAESVSYFSSLEGKALGWLNIFIGLILFAWIANLYLLVRPMVFGDDTWTSLVEYSINAVWIFPFSLMVLWQQAIYAPERPAPAFPDEALPEPLPDTPKYQKSALDDERRARIASKIEKAMTKEKLYRNPMLTLRNLSDHVGASENYISQVLNEHFERKFYDFVNSWRVKEACELLDANTMTVLMIGEEVGFNSRSTFNAAFKKETGLSPSEYRSGRQAAA